MYNIDLTKRKIIKFSILIFEGIVVYESWMWIYSRNVGGTFKKQFRIEINTRWGPYGDFFNQTPTNDALRKRGIIIYALVLIHITCRSYWNVKY